MVLSVGFRKISGTNMLTCAGCCVYHDFDLVGCFLV